LSIEHWNKLPDGNLALGSLTSWQTGMAPNRGLIRLEYAFTEAQMKAGETETCQLILTLPQMRELAELLLRTARLVEEQEAKLASVGLTR